jgi:large subunit ribosomal protein L23
MIREERLLKVLKAPHISEKSTMVAEKQNTIVFKVAVDATKAEVKAAVAKLFEVEVETVRTLNMKGKTKRSGAACRPSFRLEKGLCDPESWSGHRLHGRSRVRGVLKNGNR